MTESPSTGSGGQSSVLCPDGLPVYREIVRPYNAVIQSVHNLHLLSIHIFQQDVGSSALNCHSSEQPLISPAARAVECRRTVGPPLDYCFVIAW